MLMLERPSEIEAMMLSMVVNTAAAFSAKYIRELVSASLLTQLCAMIITR